MWQTVSFAVEAENNPDNSVVQTQQTGENLEDTTDIAPEESITTTPLTGEIDARSVKSPYENNFQEEKPKQNEFTRMVFMFLKVMVAVAICSLIIFSKSS